jgi:DNA-binding NarL/FixJ family response regulator
VLLVLADKDPHELEVLRAGLDAPDREIIALVDGENIITLARSRSPDVVVVAASLGSMGGFAVSYKLKNMADNAEITEPKTVVLLERTADAWLAKWSRCDAFLTKPVDPAEIDAVVTELAAAPTG